jgi:flagellar basal-body rod protein FlgC
MSLDHLFGVAGSALNAQTVRMNTTASNLANAGSVAGSEQEAFRAKRAVFRALMDDAMTNAGASAVGGVKVEAVVDDKAPVRKVYQPGNPLADEEGYIFQSNVSEVGEMVDMMAAARSYQNNVEVINTARQLLMRTLEVSKT